MAQTTPESPASGWQENPRLRKVPVVVCTISGTYSGCTYHLDDQRLLDALNDGFAAKSLRMGRDFMPMTDVQAYFPTGTKVPLSSRYTSTYVRKANVFFVAERSRQPSGIATESGDKTKARCPRTKKTIVAEMHMPPYILKGRIHAEVWQGLLETLDRNERFLPLTAVSIWPALANGESKFDFVAVNRDQVVYLGEPPT